MDIKSPEARSRAMVKIKNNKTNSGKFLSEPCCIKIDLGIVLTLKIYLERLIRFLLGLEWLYSFMDATSIGMPTVNILINQNIRIIIIWECTVKKMQKYENERNKIISKNFDFIGYGSVFLEL